MAGLNISRLWQANTTFTGINPVQPDVTICMMMGDSNVINGVERYRVFTGDIIAGVAAAFGTSAPEYFAAVAFASQNPQAALLQIGRWINTPTSGFLTGGILTATQQLISNWNTISNGSFTISIDGVPINVTGLDFTASLNLNGVAGVISAALIGDATVVWDGSEFIVMSDTTGVTSTVGFATTEGTGTDISGQLALTSNLALPPIPGFAVETPLEAFIALGVASTNFVGLIYGCATFPTITDYVAISNYIAASKRGFLQFCPETDSRTLSASYTADLPSVLLPLDAQYTAVQYSQSPYAACSYAAKALTIDFNANNSTITLMYKTEPTITPEILTDAQADTLAAKRCNVFAQYDNNTAIIQNGVQSGNLWTDTAVGSVWFEIGLQYAAFNAVHNTTTKIPQTNPGIGIIYTALTQFCEIAVKNGFLGPGLVWTGPNVGEIETGQVLPLGYYIFVQDIIDQPLNQRAQRISPTFQVIGTVAGAVHTGLINITLTRT